MCLRCCTIRRYGLGVSLVLSVAICLPQLATAQGLDDVIRWTGTINLEETPEVYTVAPEVKVDPKGGFIVTDYKKAQVRLYDRSGSLRHYFGGRGEGPGEFKSPFAALRLPSGELLVPEFMGTLTLFDEAGKTLLETYTRILRNIVELHILPNDRVLVAGPLKEGLGAHPLHHRFNVNTGEIEGSFFPHPIPLGTYGNILNGIGKIVVADVHTDHIVAAFAPTNRLFVFSLDGTLKREIEVPFKHFRLLEPPQKERLASSKIFEAITTFSTIERVYWLKEDIVLIQYLDILDIQKWEQRWNLACMSLEGALLFDVADAPQLLAVDPETSELFFSHPEWPTEERWIVGHVMQSR